MPSRKGRQKTVPIVPERDSSFRHRSTCCIESRELGVWFCETKPMAVWFALIPTPSQGCGGRGKTSGAARLSAEAPPLHVPR